MIIKREAQINSIINKGIYRENIDLKGKTIINFMTINFQICMKQTTAKFV